MDKYDLIIACEELKNKLVNTDIEKTTDVTVKLEIETCYITMQDLLSTLNTL